MDKKDILFIVGSTSDEAQIASALELAKSLNLTYDFVVYSAHRNLKELTAFLEGNSDNYLVIICAAGLSAALPGVVAAMVKNPVIGVPLVSGELSGMDALLSILQLPKGIPCATMGIGKQGGLNAVHLAKRIVDLHR